MEINLDHFILTGWLEVTTSNPFPKIIHDNECISTYLNKLLPPVIIISKKSLFRFIEKIIYFANNANQIHYFFNEPKK
jgi:hypothetical protein